MCMCVTYVLVGFIMNKFSGTKWQTKFNIMMPTDPLITSESNYAQQIEHTYTIMKIQNIIIWLVY